MAAIVPASVRAQKRGPQQESVALGPREKRPRHLNYEKCSFCRKDKKSCQRSGQWPEAKCQRCIEKGLECSEPISSKAVKTTEPSEAGDEEETWLEGIRKIQNQSCWLQDQQLVRSDAEFIYHEYLEYSDADATRRYHNFSRLVDDAEEETAASRRKIYIDLRTPEASESLLHIQALSNLLQGALLSKISCVQPNLTLEKDLEPVIEQIDELYRLGVVGLAKCLQESFVIKLALADLAPLRLREEADKLIRLDQEFSSSTSDDLEGFGFTAVPLLLRAQMLDDFRIIGAVISQHKQKANETDAIGRTALHVALDHIHTSSWISTGYSRGYSRTQKEYQVVDSLLKWGVPIDAQDIFRRTALHVACFNNFGIKVIQLLLEQHGLNIDAQDAVGRTAFSWAVKKGNEATAKLLLATGVVNVNSKDKIGRSPLSFAAETGDRNMVKTLLARDDIDPEMIDIWDLSPLAFALKN